MSGVGWVIAIFGGGMLLLWFLKAQLTSAVQSARLTGMKEAADSLIRGLSPYYEDQDQTVPGNVMKIIKDIGDSVDKAGDVQSQGNAYQAGLMILGDAIGEACVKKHSR